MPDRPAKLYYKIGEVAEMLGVKTHVLRYWETEFTPLRPLKTRGSHRMYSKEDIRVAALIRQLVHDEGYTIAGAKRRLRELRRAEKKAQTSTSSVTAPARMESSVAPKPAGGPSETKPDADLAEHRLRRKAADRKVAYRSELLAIRDSLTGLLEEIDNVNNDKDSAISATVEQVVPSSVPVRNR